MLVHQLLAYSIDLNLLDAARRSLKWFVENYRNIYFESFLTHETIIKSIIKNEMRTWQNGRIKPSTLFNCAM